MLFAAAAQSALDERNIAMATGRAVLDLLDLLESCSAEQLREVATVAYTNSSNPELELYATVRALEESEAEIEARSVPFPAELRPALVMQWLPLREVAAPLRVASSWCRDSEQYFRRFAQREGILRGGDSWQDSVRCCMEWYRYEWAKHLQKVLFKYYAKQWANYDYRFIPIDELVVAVHGNAYFRGPFAERTVRRVRRSIVSLVCFGKLIASPTGGGHRFNFQVAGLDDLTPMQRRVLCFYAFDGCAVPGMTDEGYSVCDVRITWSQHRTALNFLQSEGWVYSTIDDDHHKSTV